MTAGRRWTPGRGLRFVDVFNGDADGLCALHQLRLSESVEAELVTGVKREVALLERVAAAAGVVITVLDIALDSNRDALSDCLAKGARVRYFDHHFAGAIPAHPGLEVYIDESAEMCTSAIVDQYLGGRHRAWAVAGAFGDNFPDLATRLAETLSLDRRQIDILREIGEALNYNAYGQSISDLHIHPAVLYRRLAPFANPFDFYRRETVTRELTGLRESDLANAQRLPADELSERWSVHILPDRAWSARVLGTFANYLALSDSGRAHAVLKENSDDSYVVSVRAPGGAGSGADLLCRGFSSGGGRKAAAGISRLPSGELRRFLTAFKAARWDDSDAAPATGEQRRRKRTRVHRGDLPDAAAQC